jgi:hypothetical protein
LIVHPSCSKCPGPAIFQFTRLSLVPSKSIV